MLLKKINKIIYFFLSALNIFFLFKANIPSQTIGIFFLIMLTNQFLLIWVVRRAMLGEKLHKRHFIGMVAKFLLLATAFFFVVKYKHVFIIEFVLSYTFQLLILLISIKSNYKFKENI